jgi:three-Cys-motif partner protein
MSKFFDVRDSQSRSKHTILSRYAGAWAGIILNGLRPRYLQAVARGKPFRIDLMYIDGFSGQGRYVRDADQPEDPNTPVWGSPILGMIALEERASKMTGGDGIPVRVTGVLVESDPDNVMALLANLSHAGLATPYAQVGTIAEAKFGQINVVCDDFRNVVPKLVAWIGRDPFALVFIDPFGPAMDFESTRRILGRQQTDGIALFPYHDLAVRGGSALKQPDEWSGSDKGNMTRATAHFGTEQWSDIYRSGLPSEEMEGKFVELYIRQLRSMAPGLWVKRIALRFSKADRTAYYLCLTTRDADGVMRMNQVLREAEAEDLIEVSRDRDRRALERAGYDDDLFGAAGVTLTPEPTKYKPDPDEVKRDVVAVLSPGTTLTRKQLYGLLADTPYVAPEIDKALNQLKAEKLVDFDSAKRSDVSCL